VTAARPDDLDRLEYLTAVCSVLWPAPSSAAPARAGARGRAASTAGRRAASTARRRADAAGSELIVVPSLRNPRLLVPAGRRASAAAVGRYGQPGSLRARAAARGLAWALASGTGRVLLRDRLSIAVPAGAPSIEAYLGGLLGLDVQLSVHLGAARANRKPVLQLLTAAGETVAFAKVGTNPLTVGLVRDEREALDRVSAARLTAVTVPAVRHLGRWQGLEILVLSALPVWRPRRELPGGRLTAAMAEVARVAGGTSERLADSGYWRRLRARLDAAPPSADQQELLRLLAGLGTRAGERELTFGSWHGDWTPWNMASTEDGLLLWDWERFAVGVPVGFDALHYWLQAEVVSPQRDPVAAAAGCARRAPGLLGPLGVGPAAARLTALLYLAELSTRYLVDRQAAAGARLGAPGHWLIPALSAALNSPDEKGGPSW
jgi:hypothetical protein